MSYGICQCAADSPYLVKGNGHQDARCMMMPMTLLLQWCCRCLAGASEVECEDWDTGEVVKLALDSTKTAVETHRPLARCIAFLFCVRPLGWQSDGIAYGEDAQGRNKCSAAQTHAVEKTWLNTACLHCPHASMDLPEFKL
eukprot:scaffold140520_cov17-Tisochrysis_lutea.AAC.2